MRMLNDGINLASEAYGNYKNIKIIALLLIYYEIIPCQIKSRKSIVKRNLNKIILNLT